MTKYNEIIRLHDMLDSADIPTILKRLSMATTSATNKARRPCALLSNTATPMVVVLTCWKLWVC